MRLRVECPDSLEIIKELNSKLLGFSELEEKVQITLSMYLDKVKNLELMHQKSQKYDNLVQRLDGVENQYR